MKNKKSLILDYPILKAFRLNNRWIMPCEKTIQLTLAQSQMLILCGKVGPPIPDPLIGIGVNVEIGLILDCESGKELQDNAIKSEIEN